MAAVPVLGRLAGGGRAILIAFDAVGNYAISRLAFLPHPTLCVPIYGDLAGDGSHIFVNMEADGSSSVTRDVPGSGYPVPVFGTAAGAALGITLSAALTGAVTIALLTGSGVPVLPIGFVFLTGADGAYLIGADGAYLLGYA